MNFSNRWMLAALLLATLPAQAQSASTPAPAPPPPLHVGDAWVRATVPQQRATGAFMRLSASEDLRLVEVRSPVAGVVELHKMEMAGDVMTMRQIDGLDLQAGKPVALQPGGYHVMLLELKRQVKNGEHVPLLLVLSDRQRRRYTIEVDAVARGLNTAMPAAPR